MRKVSRAGQRVSVRGTEGGKAEVEKTEAPAGRGDSEGELLCSQENGSGRKSRRVSDVEEIKSEREATLRWFDTQVRGERRRNTFGGRIHKRPQEEMCGRSFRAREVRKVGEQGGSR